MIGNSKGVMLSVSTSSQDIRNTGVMSIPNSNKASLRPDTINVKGVTLNVSELALAPTKTATLVATIDPSNADTKTVTWTSDTEAVVTVVNGVVTAVADGTATITVTTTDGELTAECEVTVATA